MAFLTIFIPGGLSEADYRRARRQGPTFAGTRRRDHHDLLLTAGFTGVQETDLTAEFLETTRAWYEGREAHAKEIITTEGAETFHERQTDSLNQLRGIMDGLLRRSLFSARVPPAA